MDFVRAIILGLAQGLTEFLPISSSAHLTYLQKYLGIERPQLSFTVFLHFATLLAIVFFFREKLWEIFMDLRRIRKPKSNSSLRIFFLLIIGSLPLIVLALLFREKIESVFFNIQLVSLFLIANGMVLFLGDGMKNTYKGVRETRVGDAIVIGVAQACATLPGISRAGATIVFGLFCGLSRQWAVEYSFLLALPAILGATLLELPGVFSLLHSLSLSYFLVGGVLAFFSGYWALRVLLKFVRAGRLRYFAYYCLVLGLMVLLFSNK